MLTGASAAPASAQAADTQQRTIRTAAAQPAHTRLPAGPRAQLQPMTFMAAATARATISGDSGDQAAYSSGGGQQAVSG